MLSTLMTLAMLATLPGEDLAWIQLELFPAGWPARNDTTGVLVWPAAAESLAVRPVRSGRAMPIPIKPSPRAAAPVGPR